MNTVIADYSMGNLASIANMVSRVGGSATVSAAPEVIACASKLILPGVGAFDHGISSIRERELELPIRQAIANGASVLGICLGMQMMMRKSEALISLSCSNSESLPVIVCPSPLT